jgi:hypothetical protein
MVGELGLSFRIVVEFEFEFVEHVILCWRDFRVAFVTLRLDHATMECGSAI